jgi:putative ABC transport system permease protein
MPFDRAGATVVAAERSACTSQAPCQCWVYVISPGFLSTLRVPLIAGRDFNDSDRAGADEVVIISRRLAERLWPGEDPIGKRLTPSWLTEYHTVVGVVADVRPYGISPGEWAERTQGDVYYPHAQGIIRVAGTPAAMNLVVRTSVPRSVANALPALVAAVNRDVPLAAVHTYDSIIANANINSRSLMWLFITFSSVALLLAAFGVYGVVSYGVSERVYEIGVRIALGATRRDILAMVLRQGLTLAAAGVAIGIIASLAAGRALSSFLFGVHPADPATLLGMSGFTIAVALAAIFLPARRASRIDPMQALRRD